MGAGVVFFVNSKLFCFVMTLFSLIEVIVKKRPDLATILQYQQQQQQQTELQEEQEQRQSLGFSNTSSFGNATTANPPSQSFLTLPHSRTLTLTITLLHFL